MNTPNAERYRPILESLRNRLRADAAVVAEQALSPSGGQANGELSNARMHLGDDGSEEFSHELSAALAENEAFLHQEVEEALARLDEGYFGRCEFCSSPIPAERLDAIPYVRYCVSCSEARQAGLAVNLDRGRPRSPADTLAPEGSMQDGWRTSEDMLNGADGRHVAAHDEHAAGEPGGGGASGGLAGSNYGDGQPEIADLQDAAGSGDFDRHGARHNPREAPRSGPTGGAVGGAPARKRAT